MSEHTPGYEYACSMECQPYVDTIAENTTLREQLTFCQHEKAEMERSATMRLMRIGELEAEIERLKTELADTKRIYGNADSTNEQKWVMLEKHCERLEMAIREALASWENCGAQEHRDPQWGDTYIVDPVSFGEIAEILRKVVEK